MYSSNYGYRWPMLVVLKVGSYGGTSTRLYSGTDSPIASSALRLKLLSVLHMQPSLAHALLSSNVRSLASKEPSVR